MQPPYFLRRVFPPTEHKVAASEANMNYARKWHEAGLKITQTRIENGTNLARKWYELALKMAWTRLEKGTNRARSQEEKSFDSSVLGSKLGGQNGSNQGTIEESM